MSIRSDMDRVLLRLGDFYNPADAQAWMNSPHPLLENKWPFNMIILGRAEEVLAVIERLDAGVYL